ncbi:uncharacterized protein LOC108025944 [Drosophila biarmipes]|uniref:uncharacterized protein LOC108025944 n=1 Tax=Drosophila biarmipes TaxID=125945 RepID=UPI0007E80FD0|nr:uncharacterized protein LOC108025944 [Drosophila biarmipes]
MASLRRSHGGGRDFLQENKQNVARMETNGRCLAAAHARRVPLWRPVVLHYAERLRPHGYIGQQRQRQLHDAHEAPDLRSGLAQPYGFRHQALPKLPNLCEMAQAMAVRKEQERLQGGWEDQQKKPPMRCNGCHCHHGHQGPQANAVSLRQGHQAETASLRQGQQAEPMPPQTEGVPLAKGHQAEAEAKMSKQGEGDQADRISLVSRASRVSRRSQRMPNPSQENADPEAPLSARSSASAKTLKSRRSVSQESVRSNATIKSNITVASRSTTASKRSQVSRKSQLMEVMPPPTHLQDQKPREREVEKPAPTAYEGYTPLTATERNAALQDAQFKYGKLVEEYNHLPVSEPTLRVRNRKIAIEKQLDELDYAINMFDQPNLDMYYKK